MSCAKNMVIVGDTNQLPNVVDKHTEIRADAIFNQYNLSKGTDLQTVFYNLF